MRLAERGSDLRAAELHVATAGHDEVVDAVVGRVVVDRHDALGAGLGDRAAFVEHDVAHHDGRRGGRGGHGEGGHWCSSL